jgi:hypothetical protein
MPRFSLLIPTRNRANLLEFAVRSALAQDFPDFEVIVSDNDSSDETPAVVKRLAGDRLAGDRLRTVRTPATMSMPDHWEWALQHVRGDYLMMLCDDDAVAPNVLRRVDEVLREQKTSVVAMNRGAIYWHPSPSRQERSNTLVFGPYGVRTLRCPSRPVLKGMISRLGSWPTPRATDSFCSRAVIEDVRARAGRFFFPPAPDYSSSALVLATAPEYSLIDEPLYVAGASDQSIGYVTLHDRGPAAERFRREFKGGLFRLSPVSCFCNANIIFESYLAALNAMPERFADVKVDYAEFYLGCRLDLTGLRKNGVDVDAELDELERFRRGLPLLDRLRILRAQARDAIAYSPLGPVASGLKRLVRGAPAFPLVPQGESRTIRGDEAGFSNIFECAQRLPGIPLQR